MQIQSINTNYIHTKYIYKIHKNYTNNVHTQKRNTYNEQIHTYILLYVQYINTNTHIFIHNKQKNTKIIHIHTQNKHTHTN